MKDKGNEEHCMFNTEIKYNSIYINTTKIKPLKHKKQELTIEGRNG
jgi:hypothetical protein